MIFRLEFDQRETFEFTGFVVVSALVRCESIGAQNGAFDNGLGGLGSVHPANPGPVNDRSQVSRAQALRTLRRDRGDLPDPVEGEVLTLAQTHENHTPRNDAVLWIKDGGLLELAGEVPTGNQMPDLAVHGPVRGARGATGHGDALEKIHHNGIRLVRRDVINRNRYVHKTSPGSCFEIPAVTA